MNGTTPLGRTHQYARHILRATLRKAKLHLILITSLSIAAVGIPPLSAHKGNTPQTAYNPLGHTPRVSTTDIDLADRFVYTRAWATSIHFSQWRWWLDVQFLRAKEYRKWWGWGIFLRQLRHPRERKVQPVIQGSCGQINAQPYIPGKQNTVLLAGGYGTHMHMLFDRAVFRGAQLWTVLTGGVTLAYLKPYMLLINDLESDSTCTYRAIDATHPAFLRQDRIVSRASFWTGIGQGRFIPGLYGEAGLRFQWVQRETRIYFIECGFTILAFLDEIRIMVEPIRASRFFPSTYLRFGMGYRAIH